MQVIPRIATVHGVHLTERVTYPAPPAEVFTMLLDSDFHDAKCRATGAVDHTVEVSPTADGGARVTTRRVLPTDQVPANVRSFLGPQLAVQQVEVWGAADADGTRRGTVEVTIVGVPVRLAGTMRMTAAGPEAVGAAGHGPTAGDGAAGAGGAAASAAPGTVQTVDGDLVAQVPFLGPKIEKAAAPAVLGALRAEHEVGLKWLAGRRG